MKLGVIIATQFFLASMAHATVFKCTTPDGVVYSQAPCAQDAAPLQLQTDPDSAAEQPWQPSHFATIGDEAAVPSLTDAGRRGYRKFLSLDLPRAFIVCPDGRFTIVHGGSRKIFAREVNNHPPDCSPYAIDNNVVWVEK